MSEGPSRTSRRLWSGRRRRREGHEKFVESEALLKVYVMLAEADHDYDGHRAKAMGQVKDALKILDASIMKKGSPAEKSITAADVAMAKAAVAARDRGPAIIEGQRPSDKQLRVAHELLHKIKESLARPSKASPWNTSSTPSKNSTSPSRSGKRDPVEDGRSDSGGRSRDESGRCKELAEETFPAKHTSSKRQRGYDLTSLASSSSGFVC